MGGHEVAHDGVGLGRVAGPVHVAAGRLHRRLELLEQDVEPAHGAALDRLPGRAQLLPVGHLGHDRVALGADAARGVVQVAAQLRLARLHEARISARCRVRTPSPARRSPPPMCIRHEQSAAAHTCGAGRAHAAQLVVEHGQRDVGVLDREGAAEAAALLRVGQLDEVDVAHRAQQAQRLVPHPQRAQRVAGRVVGDAVRERGPHVLDAELVHEELGKLEHAEIGGFAHGRGARRRRGHDRVVPGEDLGQPGGQPLGLAGSTSIPVHLATAGLIERELHFAANPLEHPHGGDPRTRETACRRGR